MIFCLVRGGRRLRRLREEIDEFLNCFAGQNDLDGRRGSALDRILGVNPLVLGSIRLSWHLLPPCRIFFVSIGTTSPVRLPWRSSICMDGDIIVLTDTKEQIRCPYRRTSMESDRSPHFSIHRNGKRYVPESRQSNWDAAEAGASCELVNLERSISFMHGVLTLARRLPRVPNTFCSRALF
jgi:hypothetical protein